MVQAVAALAPAPRIAGSASRRALVLSGGGITGYLYKVGVLAALEEALPHATLAQHFDLFVGTSAGAVVAALLANDARAAEIFRVLREDLDSPFNFRPEDVFGTADGGVLRLLGQFVRPLGGAVARTLRQPSRSTLATVLADFQAHHPPGFYSTEPLERTLCERFTALGYPHRFGELRSTLRVTGVDIDTGERLVFGEGEFADAHICRAVAASCAIPIFFRPIRIGERDVMDGAVGAKPNTDSDASRTPIPGRSNTLSGRR
jgi:predicted acylesterase/phospholipase RssA